MQDSARCSSSNASYSSRVASSIPLTVRAPRLLHDPKARRNTSRYWPPAPAILHWVQCSAAAAHSGRQWGSAASGPCKTEAKGASCAPSWSPCWQPSPLGCATQRWRRSLGCRYSVHCLVPCSAVQPIGHFLSLFFFLHVIFIFFAFCRPFYFLHFFMKL